LSVVQTTFRSYVDDIAVAAKGDTPLQAAGTAKGLGLPQSRSAR
jgi:hypothetical protein